MILEYHFGALLYDEQAKNVKCALCGDPIQERKVVFHAGGRWICGGCLRKVGTAPTESILCSTLKAAAER